MSYKNFKIHIKTISNHKRLVRELCFKAGMYKQGLLHDLSKWSLTELKNGWKYADGTRSPIDNERDATGCAYSWLHHFRKNAHHYEHYFDASIGKCYDMPDKYIIESALDRVAAAKNYQKEKYTQASAFDYFVNSKRDPYRMGYNNCKKLFMILLMFKDRGEEHALETIRTGCIYYLLKDPIYMNIIECEIKQYFSMEKFDL